MRVLVFGDSIAQGFWDVEQGGWVQRLRRTYAEQDIQDLTKRRQEFFNLSVSGDSANSIVKRLPYEVETRRWQGEPFVLIFAVGLNDTQFAGDEIMATPEQYRDELDVLISGAGHYSKKLLFVGLAPVDDELCNPYRYNPRGVCFKNDRIMEFEEVLRKVCLEKEVPHVQIFEKFQAEHTQNELLADGLHPNESGHQFMADLIKPYLDNLLKS